MIIQLLGPNLLGAPFFGPHWRNPVTPIGDEDMTPSNTTIDYKVRSFIYLHSDFGYNSFGSTCTCRYLNVGKNMSQSASPSK
jgi:hypothetical protein